MKNKEELKIELTQELGQEYEAKLIDTVLKIKTEDFIKKMKDCKCEYNIICY